MPEAVYVPWLHMHQPLVWLDGELVGNLEKMLDSADSKDEWDARLMKRNSKGCPVTSAGRSTKAVAGPAVSKASERKTSGLPLSSTR